MIREEGSRHERAVRERPSPLAASTDCPGRACFELLGRKWTTQIVWVLPPGAQRFSALHSAIPGLSNKVLSNRLTELEQAGIVSRAYYQEIPPRVEYTLTPPALR